MKLNKYCQIVVSLCLSGEAETGSAGDQPDRNSLTECNGKEERKFPNPIFLLQSLMPKKTHCFERSKREKTTSINTKKGQHISGQDSARQRCSLLIRLFISE